MKIEGFKKLEKDCNNIWIRLWFFSDEFEIGIEEEREREREEEEEEEAEDSEGLCWAPCLRNGLVIPHNAPTKR